MENKNLIYKHKKKVQGLGLVLLLIGIPLAYFYYGTEPQETIAGFMCGFGISLTLVPFAIKKTN